MKIVGALGKRGGAYHELVFMPHISLPVHQECKWSHFVSLSMYWRIHMINQVYVGLTQTVANCLVISWADAHADIDEDVLVRGSAVSLTAASFPISLFSPTMEASPRVYEPKFSLDDISITSKITSSTTDDIPKTGSFIYNRSFASSDTSIASYKTKKTVNSRKNRYNTLP